MTRRIAIALVILMFGRADAASPPVSAAAFHPGGKYVVVGAHQQVIAVDAKTGDILNQLSA